MKLISFIIPLYGLSIGNNTVYFDVLLHSISIASIPLHGHYELIIINDDKERITEETVKMLGEDVDVGPVTNETCPECGHDKATYKMLQARSADEAPTRIFTCTKCKHTWRAYD